MTKLYRITLYVALVLLTACSGNNEFYNKIISTHQTPHDFDITYPFNNSIFPAEFQSPTIKWTKPGAKKYSYTLFFSKTDGTILATNQSDNESLKPDLQIWEDLKKQSLGNEIVVTIVAQSKGLLSSKRLASQVNITISADSVGAPIFFRAVPLPFGYAIKHVDEIKWYMGQVSDASPRLMLENIPVCANCHSFNNNGSILGMDVDYANDKGSYAIAPIHDTCNIDTKDIITWSDYKRFDESQTFGLLSQVSPDGENTLSTVKDRSVFVPIEDNLEYSQLFFPIKGILVNYNKATGKFIELEGANNKEYVQSNPMWSPDGKEVLFARAQRYYSEKIEQSKTALIDLADVQEFISGQKEFKFDVYKIPFNNGKGGEPVPLKGASNNGKSNYFARYSPNGKWIVFCQADNFMLLQPDSKLYIVPAQGGEARLMNCNTSNMNSWHSWSPNGKWLVFASKEKGAYTQMYLTHIDSNGMDSPPILLEQFTFDKMAVNIPEFYPATMDKFAAITDRFSQSPIYQVRLADDNLNKGDYKAAYKSVQMALQMDSLNIDANLMSIKLNKLLRQPGLKGEKQQISAIKALLNKELALKPQSQELMIQRLSLLILTNDYKAAIEQARQLIRLNSANFEAYELLCSAYVLSNKMHEAIDLYATLLRLFPERSQEILFSLRPAFQETGQFERALNLTNNQITNDPSDFELFILRAELYAGMGNKDQALKDVNKAVDLAPENYMSYMNRSRFYSLFKQKQQAQQDLSSAIDLLSNDKKLIAGNTDLLFVRADLYEQLKAYDKAMADYQRILADWPMNYYALKKIAQFYITAKDWSSAIDCYNILMQNYDPESEFFNNMALIQMQIDQPDKAVESFSKGLELIPGDEGLLNNRALLYEKIRQFDKAKSDFQTLKQILQKQADKNAQKLAEVNNHLQMLK